MTTIKKLITISCSLHHVIILCTRRSKKSIVKSGHKQWLMIIFMKIMRGLCITLLLLTCIQTDFSTEPVVNAPHMAVAVRPFSLVIRTARCRATSMLFFCVSAGRVGVVNGSHGRLIAFNERNDK